MRSKQWGGTKTPAILIILARTVQSIETVAHTNAVNGFKRLLQSSQADIDAMKQTSWATIFLYYFIFQAILGIILFEWAYAKARRFRTVDEDRDNCYRAVRRTDAHKWARWKFYPGAIFTLTTRIIMLAVGFLVMVVTTGFISIGHNFKKGPMRDGCRKRLNKRIYRGCSAYGIFVCGMSQTIVYQEIDYSYYLGKDYKKQYRDIQKTATVVSNHVSWIDPMILTVAVAPAFAPSSFYRTVPVLSQACQILDSIFIDRGADEASRQKVVDTICDRQKEIETTGKYAPFCMFPEGGTTNGTALLKFKRGAFIGQRRVTPMYMKYHSSNGFSTEYAVIDFLPLVFMTLCRSGLKCDVNIMSDFEPTEYLFKKHADKGKERWEIFAWAVRDAMAKCGQFELSNLKLQDKVDYYKYMMNYKGAPDRSKDDEVRQRLLTADGCDTQRSNINKGAFDPVEEKIRSSMLSRGSHRSAASYEMQQMRPSAVLA